MQSQYRALHYTRSASRGNKALAIVIMLKRRVASLAVQHKNTLWTWE